MAAVQIKGAGGPVLTRFVDDFQTRIILFFLCWDNMQTRDLASIFFFFGDVKTVDW